MSVAVFDPRICELGEGAFWHPLRKQAFWFDILGKRLLSTNDTRWDFSEHVSACGWLSQDELLIASETALFRFDLLTGTRQDLVPLEAENTDTRSNDGRADPQGGFWIGTMAKDGSAGQGAIYRFYRGELRQLRKDMSIPNAICFAPDGQSAYFADTQDRRVWSQKLNSDGWPSGEAQLFLDIRSEGLNPDGAVIDSDGRFWNAQWGAGRVACYDPDGSFRKAIDLPAAQTSCPAFIGEGLNQLMVTTASDGATGPADGQTFVVDCDGVAGQAEHQVLA